MPFYLYIQQHHPLLLPLYQQIYTKNDRLYWQALDADLRAYAAEIGLDYVTNDDSMKRPFNDPPIIVNYFYHEQIKKSVIKSQNNL